MSKKNQAFPNRLLNYKSIIILISLLALMVISHLIVELIIDYHQYRINVFIAYTCIFMVVFLYVIFSRQAYRRRWVAKLRKYNEYKLSSWEIKLVDRFYTNAKYELRSVDYATIRLNILITIITLPSFIYSLACMIAYIVKTAQSTI
ncbi:hypothetical protein [Ureaplasma urealyticum]|uniref:DUF3899 domain-containing protein n=2 Tax=Ureaplasma urealyticum TaxID=2130 RepID=A0AAP9ACN8_UREUR|nr:hypothetical protein [Ureaplasma urealyticum]RCT49081.1 hypothetical protein DTQ68_03155 [Ureaplasma parvum]EDU06057.1 conserved hypothetical protein [Ureaplasma urealyticum serovar 5 str. ATCC 27817]EDU67082.1 conserved hypothetical protein [Ureaplasma urealyticum serovar 11 str. ATCC 33695]EDX53538.1 conserved hypothetical protein [Ureaplasma urealyticum serovar 12 str. ATCC 33696]EEH01314.1 conserved hypothetical protein [Ureaplasma urealyticum serovar 8 str. ATCC 27618]